ncbi:PREDICTED: chaperone protein ClpB4, mitochondrial-like [Camelina sativa]|uniref:Chaperone protein ClpB4, mitochondrial-like n=1 Tax=Camelina sativa TaxID=90675 RepID=A0ABM0SWT1_CAMSA|nr:PREDICTED: chaperone protein ClpB4, mitochondrial-like [Camelina sativa]
MMKQQALELARQTFKPEFMKRIDEYIVFQPLDLTELTKILEFQMRRVKNLLEQKKIKLEYTKEAVDLLAQLGFAKQWGKAGEESDSGDSEGDILKKFEGRVHRGRHYSSRC